MPELICKLLHIGKTTYYKYLKEGYPIVTFLLSLTKEEVEELLNTGKIEKFNYVDSYFKNLRSKCNDTYLKIEHLKIKYKNPAVDYDATSIFTSQNFYMLYVFPFLKKHEEEIKLFDSNNFKVNFFNLALTHHFEFRNNGIKESYVTFQILEILDDLSNTELYYFFNKFNIMED